jgi:uncharacterized protein YjiS (DUF1127 family)
MTSAEVKRRLVEAYELAVVNSLRARRLQVAAERDLRDAGVMEGDIMAAFNRGFAKHHKQVI